ncbi:GNAT family N-acetyltransferase [Affinibrenneria salicis]|uniref:GNAT family N-acetyltransferase n=1 Tax=Affinibrenneria salicis TaxID=2590031 RepID=A0A5J5FXD2_9GAMM|nr:GNAT family N-acetyltransferase [Affinibrenneria salicis]
MQSPPAQSGPDIAPVITDRLRLRPFAREDRAAWADWNSRPDVYRFLLRHAPQGDALATRFQSILNAGHRFHQDGDELRLAVERRGDQALIGEVVLKLTSQSAGQAEVGYIFSPSVIGQGYATEAVRAMISFGFAAFGFQRIFARLDAGNIGSVGVLERLGLRREAHLLQSSYFDGSWSDEYIYAILHREWSAGE